MAEAASSSPVVSSTSEGAPVQPMHFEVLKVVKDNRMLRGLRHTNYLRYRNYCNARIKRIRRTLCLTTGPKRRNYQRRQVAKTPSPNDPRQIELQILYCERSWARSMELREINATEHSPRIKLHIHRKLRKASKYAQQLFELVQERADARTVLETEAYTTGVASLLDLEDKEWGEAYKKLNKAQLIYDQLAKRCPEPQLIEICNLRISEIQLSLRICKHNLGDEAPNLIGTEESNDTLESLSAKLEALSLISTASASETEAAGREFVFTGGLTVQIRSEIVRQTLTSAQSIVVSINKLSDNDFDKRMELFDQLFLLYNEAQMAVQRNIQSLQDGGASSIKQTAHLNELEQLSTGIKLARLTQTIQRNKSIVSSLVAKKSPSRELVRQYDAILQNLRDIDGLQVENADLLKNLASRTQLVKAQRCFHLSQDYISQQRFPEALVLLNQAQQYLDSSLQHSSGQLQDAQLHKELAETKAEIDRNLLCMRANLVLASSNEQDVQVSTTQDLVAGSDIFSFSFAETGHFSSILPPFEPMPCKPQLFDLAISAIEFPDIEARSKVQKKGWFGFW